MLQAGICRPRSNYSLPFDKQETLCMHICIIFCFIISVYFPLLGVAHLSRRFPHAEHLCIYIFRHLRLYQY